MQEQGLVTHRQLRLLLLGSHDVSSSIDAETPRSLSSVQGGPLLNENGFELLLLYGQDIPRFTDLVQAFQTDRQEWCSWRDSDNLYQKRLPSGWEDISQFEKLLLIKLVRPDQLSKAIAMWTTDYLDRLVTTKRSLHTNCKTSWNSLLRQQDLAHMLVRVEDVMDCQTPCCLVLPSGVSESVDYLPTFRTLAESHGIALNHLHTVSLGTGQGPQTRALIEDSMRTGDWVIIQNCHLAGTWMPELERLVRVLGTSNLLTEPSSSSPSSEFRLFLTTLPSNSFPRRLLSSCVRIMVQPATGLRVTAERLFDSTFSTTAHEHDGDKGGEWLSEWADVLVHGAGDRECQIFT